MNAGSTSYRTAMRRTRDANCWRAASFPVTGHGLGCEVSGASAACRYQEGLQLKSAQVRSALEITAKVVELYDYLYAKFPDAYIANDGKRPNPKTIRWIDWAHPCAGGEHGF